MDFSAAQAERILRQYPGYAPMYTVGGKWGREGETWTHWCEGFFPGILWLLHRHTGESRWAEAARRLSRPLEKRQLDRSVHDLGFLFFSTYLREFNLTGDPRCRDTLIQAGRTLALRRQPGGYLASFVGPQSLFIDVMMNVGLILYAANATGDDRLRQIALEHCRTTQTYLVGADGGTAHEGVFDPATGRFLPQHASGLECGKHLEPRLGLGDLRIHRGPQAVWRGRIPRHGPPMCRLLPPPFAARIGTSLGFRSSGPCPASLRQLGGGNRGQRPVGPV